LLPIGASLTAQQQDASGVPARISATIDAAKLSEPISKYDYGMFIEHIGTLINHGIWAELLDDRKFYFPVTSVEPKRENQMGSFMRQERHWAPIGPDASVTMDPVNPYVGEQSPKIALDATTPQGIQQAGLSLINGKAYVGRVILFATPGAKIEIALVWGDGASERQTIPIADLKSGYARYPLKFTSGADTHDGRLEIVGRGTGSFHVGAVSLMPADNIEGFRPEVIKLLHDLDSGMWRLPGGNFISGYDWRDTIGDPDKRPPKWDTAWNYAQPNDVGIDELMTMCKLMNVDPYVSVSDGYSDARSGAELVEYVNGAATTPMGALRAKNGHPEPYHVKYWNIGNEMYGFWQIGHMALPYYTVKHNLFAEAMRKVDPSITIIASGAMPDEMTITANARLVTSKVQAEFGTAADWTGGLFAHSLPYLDAVSEHAYTYDGRRFDPDIVARKDIFDPNYGNADVFAKVDEPLVDSLRRPSNRVRLEAEEWEVYKKTYPDIVTRKIFAANDEWANMGSDTPMGSNLRISLGYSLVLQEMFRHTDFIKMSAFTMGTSTLDSSETDAVYNSTGLTFKLYRDHFGTIPVAVSGNSPQPAPKFPVSGDQPAVNAGSPTFPLDLSAAFTADHKFLTVAVVNPTETAQPLDLNFNGVRLGVNTTLWQLTGPSQKSVNVVGKKPDVSITSTPVSGVPNSLTIPPLSMNIYQIPVQ
jgi:alpha-N-arabinofuranosidase